MGQIKECVETRENGIGNGMGRTREATTASPSIHILLRLLTVLRQGKQQTCSQTLLFKLSLKALIL